MMPAPYIRLRPKRSERYPESGTVINENAAATSTVASIVELLSFSTFVP